MRLDGCVVLLTGASRGLGRALAEALAARGARVACVARDAAGLEATVAAARAAGGEAHAFPCDLSDLAAVPGLVERVTASVGPVSLLVVNHGATTAGEIADLELEHFEHDLRVNFLSAAALTRALLPGLAERGGTLAFVLSGLALRPLPAWSSYAASKAALRGYAEALRIELAGGPVRVVTIQPGTMRTGFLDRMARVGDPKILQSRRAAPPERVARAVVRGLERDRARIARFGPASLVGVADLVAPGLIDRLLARLYRRP